MILFDIIGGSAIQRRFAVLISNLTSLRSTTA
jgi:hypothetical protein